MRFPRSVALLVLAVLGCQIEARPAFTAHQSFTFNP